MKKSRVLVGIYKNAGEWKRGLVKTSEYWPKTAGKRETLEEDLKRKFGCTSKNSNIYFK